MKSNLFLLTFFLLLVQKNSYAKLDSLTEDQLDEVSAQGMANNPTVNLILLQTIEAINQRSQEIVQQIQTQSPDQNISNEEALEEFNKQMTNDLSLAAILQKALENIRNAGFVDFDGEFILGEFNGTTTPVTIKNSSGEILVEQQIENQIFDFSINNLKSINSSESMGSFKFEGVQVVGNNPEVYLNIVVQ